ncbi:MAG: diacylglycerol/lipid kinase family protein [Chitinophagales bacterium]
MPRKIIYLINPVSGVKPKSSLIKLLERRTREQEIEFDIVQTPAACDYKTLLKKIHHEQFTDIVICGGDGTVNAVAAALNTYDINVGIIPMGSGNGLAYTAKIPKQASRALDIIFKGKTSRIDALYINEKFSCMLCGIGFDAQVAHEFAKQKRRGLQTYIKVATIQYFKARPYFFDININNESIQTEAYFICIANSNQFGNNFTIAPQASLNDGLLDIVIVKKMSKFILPFSVISQVTGINAIQSVSEFTNTRNIMYLQSAEMTIRNPEMAPLHIDGDPSETSAIFNIRIQKKCIRLIQPE